MKPVDNIITALFIVTHSYKEQSSGEGSSGGEYEFQPGEDYYYEEEQDNRPTVEKVHIQDSHTIFNVLSVYTQVLQQRSGKIGG